MPSAPGTPVHTHQQPQNNHSWFLLGVGAGAHMPFLSSYNSPTAWMELRTSWRTLPSCPTSNPPWFLGPPGGRAPGGKAEEVPAFLFVWGHPLWPAGTVVVGLAVACGLFLRGDDCPEALPWSPLVHTGDSVLRQDLQGTLGCAALQGPLGLRDGLSLQIDYIWFAQKAFMAL